MWCKMESTLFIAVLVTVVYTSKGIPFEVLNGVGTFNIKHSVSQTQGGGSLEFLYVPGQSLSVGPETSIITDRYQCGDYAMDLYVADPSNPARLHLNISLPGEVTTDDDPECRIYWGDGAFDSKFRIKDNQSEISHQYSAYGIYSVSMRCKDDINKKDRIDCPIQYTQCFKDDNFFDDDNKMFDKPLFFLSTDPILVDSYMEFANSTCTAPIINWRITNVNATLHFIPFVNFTQTNSSILSLPRGTLANGDYIVTLEVQFPLLSNYEWTEDLFILKVVDPELVAHISAGDYLEFPHGNELQIFADKSYDPMNESNVLQPLEASWSFVVFTVLPLENLNSLIMFFPSISLPPQAIAPHKIHAVQNGTDYILKVNTALLPVNSYCLAVFSLSRSTRMASAMQIVKLVSNALPMSIDCIYNCHVGRERLFYYDKLQLDLSIQPGIDTTGFIYSWSVLELNATKTGFDIPTRAIATTTGDILVNNSLNKGRKEINEVNNGYATPSLGITKGSLVQGKTYQISVTVISPRHTASTAQLVKTVNYIPFNGTCELAYGRTNFTSAREWVTFSCQSWVKIDAITGVTDYSPILSFTVKQITAGAKVVDEPILQTRSKKSFIILKVGDPNNNYLTKIIFRVTDVYKNYYQEVLLVNSWPAFAVKFVEPTEEGATLIRSYTETDYPFDEQQLYDMGQSDMMITLVSSVCSNIHLIDLGEWTPPVPRVLNSDGFVMDLNAKGNKDVGNLDEVMEDAENNLNDPATVAIQDVMLRMVQFTRNIVETDLSGSRSGDKWLASLVTNAFTNLVAQPRYLNYNSMINIIYLAKLVGFDALIPKGPAGDNPAQTETTSGEIYYMFQEIVQSSVPDDFVEIRPVGNLASGMNNIDEMLSALAENISLYDSQLSPVERGYLYVRMQKHLKYNTKDKKKTAKDAAWMTLQLAQEVQNQWRLCRRCSNVGNKNTKQLLANEKSDHFVTQMTATATSEFRIDGLNDSLTNVTRDNFDTISVSAFEFQENVYMYDEDGTSSYVTSKVLRLDVKSVDTRVTPGYMTFQQTVMTPIPEYVIPEVHEEDVSEFMYHRLIYQKATDELCMIVEPQGVYSFTEYSVYIKYSSVPSIIEYDFIVSVRQEFHWQLCIPPDKMNNHTGLTYMAVQLPGIMKTISYNLTVVTVGCLTWEEKISKWHTDKCQLVWKPDESVVSCFCKEITDLVFSNSFFVAPNSIDFNTVFLRFSPLNQAAVLGTFGCLFVCYIVAVIFLSRLDRQDALKWGLTPLRDNMIDESYYYIIKVFTGMRRGAGTKSRIAFILTGSDGSTRPRELYDGIREEFSTGSVMSFFMATKQPLGDLLHLYIWHDNSGGSQAEWYLNQVVVYDIETLKAYTFVAERWLSVDTHIDACLPSSPVDRPIKFETRFFFQLRDKFSENHTWISIIYRPQTSTFTRVQRVSCALAFIFLTMLANAMYFNPAPNYISPAILEVGPFRFTKQQIFISIICALITTPPIMLIVYIFQHTKRRKCKENGLKNKSGKCCQKQRSDTYADKLREIQLTSETPELKGGMVFPFWFVFIGWLLVLGAVASSAFFIVLYSIEWGKQKSEEWLTTFFMSIFESVLFVDPILVICIVLVLSLLLRTNDVDKNIDMQHIVERYKQMKGLYENDELRLTIQVLQSVKTDFELLEKDPLRVTPPLQGRDLALAAESRRRKIVMTSFAKDIVLNMLLIIILFSIAYANRDGNSYFHHKEIVNAIVEPWKLPQFNDIKKAGDLYNWLNISVIPSIFPEYDMNGAPLHWTVRQFTTGYNNLRLGPPRLRQLRTKKKTCVIPFIGRASCYGKYKVLDDEERDFCIGWSNPPCPEFQAVFNSSADAWKYTSGLDIWGLPTPGMHSTYSGGGYIATFDVSRNISIEMLNELFRSVWMDRKTRAVIFEFTLYNAVTNMFIYNIFLTEFLETGGVITTYSIYPVRVYTHHGAIGTYTLLCEIIFVIYLIAIFVKISVRVYQKRLKFFKDFWHVYELVMLLIGIVIVVFFALRLSFAFSTINKFNEDKKSFVNFGHIIMWDQMLVTALAILVFMSTLRMLEVFASSKKINAVIQVFHDCGKDLFWYSLAFIHFFIAFCMLGLVLFGSKLTSYKDFYNTMGTLFVALIGKSKFTEIDDTEPILAKLFFSFYIITVGFFVLSIFLSILGASIDIAIHDSRKDPREDLVEHLMTTFKSLFIRPTRQTTLQEDHPTPAPPEQDEENIEDIASLHTVTPTLEDDDVISQMSEEDIILPPVIKRSKTQFKPRFQPKVKPPWRP